MDTQQLPIVAADGHRFVVESATPPSPTGVVLVLPAMGVGAGYYGPFVGQLVGAGLAAVTMDWRGHGLSDLRASRRVDWGYRELIEVDLAATVTTVEERFGDLPRWALGHSLGGHVALLHASVNPGSFAGVATMASCVIHFSGWGFPASLGALAATQLARGVAMTLGYFPGDKVRFAGREGRQQMIDWANNGLTGKWKIAGSQHDYDSRLAEMTLPVLGMSIERDSYAPRRAVDNLMAAIPNADISRHHWTADELGNAGLHHIRWVRHSAPIAARIARWIGSQQ